MTIFVIGGGGREHALVWKLLQSPRVKKIFCAPGNAGIRAEAECIPWDGKSLDALLAIGERIKPDLTIVGPEIPLMMGVVDRFSERGFPTFGPTEAAARLESSKGFAKEFMQRHRIPTPHYALCRSLDDVRAALPHFSGKIVVKADGLAAGKGVVIAESADEAASISADMLSGKMLGQAGTVVVLEEFLEGEEVSFLLISDGTHVAPLAPAQDHKRIGEGDTGANTGGMGAYSIDALLAPEMREWLVRHIALPVIRGMKEEGSEFRGVLYCGLMMTATGPQVLEFNCRFGDPETQPILMRLESDIVELFLASVEGRLASAEPSFSSDATACIVIASGGYPGTYETGKAIIGLEKAAAVDGVQVFHAGTAFKDGDIVTAGGRVLGVTARGESLSQALERAYDAAEKIRFPGMYYRRDIGHRARKD